MLHDIQLLIEVDHPVVPQDLLIAISKKVMELDFIGYMDLHYLGTTDREEAPPVEQHDVLPLEFLSNKLDKKKMN